VEDEDQQGHFRRGYGRGKTRVASTEELCRRGVAAVVLEVPPCGADVDGYKFKPGLVTVREAAVGWRLILQGARVDSLVVGRGRVPAWW